MKIFNTILFVNILSVMVMLLVSCSDEASQEKIETLRIDQIWNDQIPANYVDEINNPQGCYKDKEAMSYLLIPGSVVQEQNITVKLYGCWDSGLYIRGSCEKFQGFKTREEDNVVYLQILKRVTNNSPCRSDAMIDILSLKAEYNITNHYKSGDIVELLIQNPDGTTLRHRLTIH